jgi:hypothetical protein
MFGFMNSKSSRIAALKRWFIQNQASFYLVIGLSIVGAALLIWGPEAYRHFPANGGLHRFYWWRRF